MNRLEDKEQTLVNLNPGESGVVRGVIGGQGVRRNLENLGVRKGSRIKVISRHFKGGPVVIRTGSTRVAIGFGMASKVRVRAS
ncbi:MAG: ferrous iron transport protein A [Candidatus Latescibacteria bacterium]|nr:ferrous iron transport protein A [bacterium]MBD3424452.1 ferrous iron transport protein A [Candidatus Latescibacterota bacterium]